MENPYYIDPVEEFERLAVHIAKQQKRTIQKKKEFLMQYRLEHGNVSRTCVKVGITRRTFYNWENGDKYFKEVLPYVGADYASDEASVTLKELALQGHFRSLKHFLKRHSQNYKPVRPPRMLTDSKGSPIRDSKGRYKSFAPGSI